MILSIDNIIVNYPPNNNGRDIPWSHPVIFLAGPIQGAADWQTFAINLIAQNLPDQQRNPIEICNPRTTGTWHGDYEGQVDWETKHLQRAYNNGIIVFWLAKQETHYCERPHGQTSRFEIGEWFGKASLYPHEADYKQYRFAVGIEPGFTNERYITRRFKQIWPDFQIPNTLEDTVKLAMTNLTKICFASI